jgi:S1-C subfamily serine protease
VRRVPSSLVLACALLLTATVAVAGTPATLPPVSPSGPPIVLPPVPPNLLRPVPPTAPLPASAPKPALVSTGTAFVVGKDGHLLTCLHVVKGATRVRVTLGEKGYDAAVLCTDEKHDLAVIRVQAADLPTLPLADSSSVELGQEIRAFGFPLGHMLGQDLKVTRGTVSGISERGGRKILQVDAAVNPGNSGGPLVNEKGEVVGVVNAKIMDVKVSNVGFSVPINYAKELLLGRGVSFLREGAGGKLDGPALVKRVAPSVAFVTSSGMPTAATTPPTSQPPKLNLPPGPKAYLPPRGGGV